jgi:ribosomal protein L11 methyltransferase
LSDRDSPIAIGAGPGFGDGTHPTTQVCLQAIQFLAPRDRAWRMLDFGSGSGILSIRAAQLGASVLAVEIDPAAMEHGRSNAGANGVAHRIEHSRTLDAAPGPFDLIVANILRAVLLTFAERVAARLSPAGALVLSGLVSTDVPELSARYSPLMDRPGRNARPEIYERGDWRALVWRAARTA